MLPIQLPEGTHLLAWIQVDVFAVDLDYGDVIIQLVKAEIVDRRRMA